MAWETAPKKTAAQWREYRRSKGIPPKADMPTILPPHIAETGRQLTRMLMLPALDWRPDLFEDIVSQNRDTTAPLFAPKRVDTASCGCGCGIKHNHAVSGLEGEHGSRRVVWFRTIGCKNKHFGIGPKNWDVT